MKSRYCVAGDHTVYGEDADIMGDELGDGFVCKDCQSDGYDLEEDED